MKPETATSLVAHLPDHTPLCALTVPGTHDTMTSTCTHPYYRTQDLSLADQLAAGVRFLDLRLRRTMVAAHREWVSDVTAVSILATLRKHLRDHPRDFILARFQNANEAKDDFPAYGPALQALIRPNLDLFWVPEHASGRTLWPTVGQVRGKVVAFECSPPQLGLAVLDGQPWAAPWHQNPGILLQDDWDGPPVGSKLAQVRSLYQHTGDADRLVLNHVSATNGSLGTPGAYAERLNPQVRKLVSQEPGRGVLIFDFIDAGTIQAVWQANQQPAGVPGRR
ncbi:PI-PLC domain-containing protein [Actinomyces weissii]|uniref:Phosphatidylinositol diacylglycerol-lyase n=1 Tax=Actinomyces weissii TaxID=675090 RepID=A0A7T7S1H2_9ACTO|nr:hypothetical protein [Actinomyces weissii]QQM66627.1 hypothetical protein JG540_05805 [Actinomyces weissii]